MVELEGEVNRLAERCKELVITSELSVEVSYFSILERSLKGHEFYGCSLCSVRPIAILAPLYVLLVQPCKPPECTYISVPKSFCCHEIVLFHVFM